MQSQSIFAGSPQWNYAQFRLQLILSQPNIEILSMEKNSSIHNFIESKDGYFRIDAAIDVTEQSEGEVNYYKSNAKKGSVFKCGRIQQECKFQDGLGTQKTYRLLLFKLVVKHLLPIYNSPSITKTDLINFTQDYDSIYLAPRKQQLSVYDHQYFLKSVSQYMWEFDVVYRYVNANEPSSKIRKFNAQTIKCQECLNSKADWYCVEERMLFCRDCYEETHKGKFRNPHQKETLTPFNCHKKCQKAAHNQNPLQFYCFNCKALKCQKCLADSSHAQNRYLLNKIQPAQHSSSSIGMKRTSHEFLSVRQLIQMYQEKQQRTITELKDQLVEKIKQVQSVISLQSRKYSQKLKQLQDTLAQAIFNLKKQSRKEINEAVAVQVQLKRKFDEAIWIEKFLSYNQEVLDAQSNIRLKEVYSSFISFMNAQEYFKKIDQKISVMKAEFQ